MLRAITKCYDTDIAFAKLLSVILILGIEHKQSVIFKMANNFKVSLQLYFTILVAMLLIYIFI